ncbi:MAG: HEAT repeat domain-containing protein [Nitrospirae bacterium]|nr:HEAT repeat domain-containing protein [Nitrospirota bacterium]
MVNKLVHPDASIRRSAAEALSKGDERAIYPLIKALSDENTGVQDAATRSLISIGGEVTAYMVLPLLRYDSYLRNTAIRILNEIGEKVIPLLRPLLKDKDDDIRKFALDLICEIRQCDYPDEIVEVLVNDTNPNVRTSAAKALGILNYRKSLPYLIEALKDDEWVCIATLEALAYLKDESSVEPIILLLDSPSGLIRYVAMDTLGVIASQRCCDALLSHLSKAEGDEKTQTIKNLLKIGVTPSIPGISDTLIEIFKESNWDERFIVLKALTEIKEERAIYPVIDIAGSLDPSHPESEERIFMIKEHLKSFGCSDMFLKILNDPSIKFRGRILTIEILGELKCKNSVSYLKRLLESDISGVRMASLSALGIIDSEEIKN